MGLLSRLWQWIAGSGDEAADSEAEGTEETADEPRLDPENVTEVRTGSADDPVEKLKDIKADHEDDPPEDDQSG